MENASKALTIAGGLLVAVLIISAIVAMFGSSSSLFKSEEDQKEIEQLVAFNKEYESYNKKLLRGTDVISVINKVLDNNYKYTKEYNEPNYIMDVEFMMKEEIVYVANKNQAGGWDINHGNVTFKIDKWYTIEDYQKNIRNNKEVFTDFKRRIFDCTKLEYNKTTGRVSKMQFTERKMHQNEYENGIIYD